VSALDNRLKLNAAINHTSITNRIWPNSSALNYDPTQKVDVSKTSPMIGGMFDITKEISIFAVHSTSLFPTTDKNSFSVQMPAEVGKSNEVGVKVELLNGKISGTVSYYKINKTGGGVTDSSANNINTQAWDAMTAAQRAVAYPGKTRSDIAGDVVPAELESKGFEADLVYQPTRNLQFVFSYANNDEKSTKGANLGQPTSGNIKQQYVVLSKYSFTEGAAKGLFLGVGFQSAGKALQDYQTQGTAQVARYNPSTIYVEFFSGYKFKAFGYNQMVQLNVKNLTQQDDFIGWKPTGSASTVATQRYTVPTYATFSISYGLDF
jgi:outer membrane receptor protein involved in Fe transport